VVWWQDEFTLPLPQEIERAIASVEWRKFAEDYDFS
jgi:hypothetical protein